MRISRGIAALAGLLLLFCAAVAWEWYSHLPDGAPRSVQQIAAAPTPNASARPSASPGPVTYVTRPTAAPPSKQSPGSPAHALPESTAPSPQSQTGTPPPYVTNGSSAATAMPVVQATLAPHVVAVNPIDEPADAPPEILSMSLSSPVAHGGELVSGTVETSSNVASVEARIAGYSSPMQKIGVGRFALSYRVPKLPFFLHKTYMIQVIARNTQGQAVSTAVPITIR